MYWPALDQRDPGPKFLVWSSFIKKGIDVLSAVELGNAPDTKLSPESFQ